MALPNVHHHDGGHPNSDPDLHPPGPASSQPRPSYQLQPQEEAKSSSPLHSSQSSTPLHLPTSRQFLTSLITAISNIPLLDDEPPTLIHKPAPAPAPAPKPGPGPGSQTKVDLRATTETETTIRRKQLLQILKEEGEEGKEEEDEDVATTRNKNKMKMPGDGQVNPLKLVPPEYRHLIITLHVLFPGVVLPGLEVLERGLVERVVLRSASFGGNTLASGSDQKKEEHGSGQEQEGDLDVAMGEDGGEEDDDGDHNNNPNNLHHHPKPEQQQQQQQQQHLPSFYLVRSSQFLSIQPKRKRKYPSSTLSGPHRDADTEGLLSGVGGGEADRERDHRIQRYMVSLEAWNCTCAAFAFASSVSEPETGAGNARDAGVGEELQGKRERERDRTGSAGWTFGGMTLFNAGDDSSVPPVCKHLLACLLADKWRRALGRYVTERLVSREEMAGIVADV